jgi:hypothetical protein
MKTSVAITLIVCGTVLICVPYVYNSIGTWQASQMRGSLHSGLPSFYHTACLFVGIAIIVAGIIGAAKSRAK